MVLFASKEAKSTAAAPPRTWSRLPFTRGFYAGDVESPLLLLSARAAAAASNRHRCCLAFVAAVVAAAAAAAAAATATAIAFM